MMPAIAFSYCTLIDEILTQKHFDPVVTSVIHKGKNILQKRHPKGDSKTIKNQKQPDVTREDETHLDDPEGAKPKIEIYPELLDYLNTKTNNDEVNWDDLAEEAARYNSDRPPSIQHPPSYANLSSHMACLTFDPNRELKDKIELLKEQIKLEKEHQDLITQLEKLKSKKINTGNKNKLDTSHTNKSRIGGAKFSRQQDSMLELDRLETFPVFQTRNAEGEALRHHTSFDFKVIKELKTAVAQYGATASYTTAILDSVAENWLTPGDWHTLARATLSGGDYLLWKSEYIENCKDTARRNAQAENGWNFEMLAGEGNYATTEAQIQYDAGLFAQIQTAATRAWRKLPCKGDVGSSLMGIKQGPDELFADFVHRLLTAANRIFGNTDSGTDFVRQLAFENANAACQAAIRPYKKKTDLSGYIHLCADIGAAYQQGLAMAAALQGYTVK